MLIKPLLILLLLALSGCASNQNFITAEEVSNSPESKKIIPSNRLSRQLYKIDIEKANITKSLSLDYDDSLKIVIWGYPELSHTTSIQPDGKIVLPFIGEVYAYGYTVDELTQIVEHKYKMQMENSVVTVNINDRFKLMIWNRPELTHIAEVQMDGYMVLPLIGEVKAQGKTIREIRDYITSRYSKYLQSPKVSILPEKLNVNHVVNPNVSILPVKLAGRKVSMFGEVQIQGLHKIHGNMRIMELMAAAGYMNSADLNSVVIIRDHNNTVESQYISLRLDDFMDGEAPKQNIYVKSNDIVIIPKTSIATVGDFVEKFFTRTKPMFDWWISAQEARYAKDVGLATKRLNDLIFDQE